MTSFMNDASRKNRLEIQIRDKKLKSQKAQNRFEDLIIDAALP